MTHIHKNTFVNTPGFKRFLNTHVGSSSHSPVLRSRSTLCRSLPVWSSTPVVSSRRRRAKNPWHTRSASFQSTFLCLRCDHCSFSQHLKKKTRGWKRCLKSSRISESFPKLNISMFLHFFYYCFSFQYCIILSIGLNYPPSLSRAACLLYIKLLGCNRLCLK